MHKYKLLLEYEGTRYRGWQAQVNARSVQGEVAAAAGDFFGSAVEVQGAGRTDAGVHALGQVAHIGAEKKVDPRRIMPEMNDRLPPDINVLKVEAVHPRFHARHHAVSRGYLYIISRRRTAFGKRFVWWIKDDLDADKMRSAAALFAGFHDFVSFADKRMDKDASTTVDVGKTALRESGDLITFRVLGSHFLWKMVRRMVGVLVEVGRGNITAGDVTDMLETFSAFPAQHTAPPSGLFLEQVLYEGDQWRHNTLPGFPLPGSIGDR